MSVRWTHNRCGLVVSLVLLFAVLGGSLCCACPGDGDEDGCECSASCCGGGLVNAAVPPSVPEHLPVAHLPHQDSRVTRADVASSLLRPPCL